MFAFNSLSKIVIGEILYLGREAGGSVQVLRFEDFTMFPDSKI